jgi:L-asparaginase
MPLAEVISSGGGPDADRGTVCFLVRDHDGNWAGGASSSGWAYKYPGRLGDSPIIGAGLYVDNRYGAAACTHIGEMTVRAGTCRAVVAYLKKGATVEEACAEAVDDLRRLRGGFFGPVVIHAVDADGNPCVVAVDMDRTVDYWFWREGFEEAELGKAALAKLYAT